MVNGQSQDALELGVKAGRLAMWATIIADEAAKHVAGRDESMHKMMTGAIDQLDHGAWYMVGTVGYAGGGGGTKQRSRVSM